MPPRNITVFDTTLRDGEQAPGAALDLEQKLAIARQLAALRVDVIEAGFPNSSPADFEAVRMIANEVQGPVICGLARCTSADIESCWNAVREAPVHRIHAFLSTSDIHITEKLRKTRSQVLEMAVAGVRLARTLCPDVEFSAEDALRTDREYLAEIVAAVIEAGATTINLPDTVGYTTPREMAEMLRYLYEWAPQLSKVVASMHCHNDLGLAVANTLAGVCSGAGQVECSINGMGERAGNASLEELVMAIKTRQDVLGVTTGIDTTQITRTSRLVSSMTGFPVPPNKAIVGANAFAHEAGIHQHGVLADRRTYEIMLPEDVGLTGSNLTLGPRSGKHGLQARLRDLGYEVVGEELNRAYVRFVLLADRKKRIYDEDLVAIMTEAGNQTDAWELLSLEVRTETNLPPYALIVLKRRASDDIFELPAQGNGGLGDGPVEAAFIAVGKIVGRDPLFAGQDFKLEDYSLRSIGFGADAQGEASVHVRCNGDVAVGVAASTDVVEASVRAYLSAVNRLMMMRKSAAGE